MDSEGWVFDTEGPGTVGAPVSIEGDGQLMARFVTTMGQIEAVLHENETPRTIANFVALATGTVEWTKPDGSKTTDPLYSGLKFHRVIPDFMIQGGGFDKSFKQKPTRAPIENEAANGLDNDKGTIAMARTSDKDSATLYSYRWRFFRRCMAGRGLRQSRGHGCWWLA